MEGKGKRGFSTILILILLGIVLLETGILLFATSCGKNLFSLTGASSVSGKQQSASASGTKPDWNPFQEMRLLREHVNQMIDDSFNRGLVNPAMQGMNEQFAVYEPEIDVAENEKFVIVRCDLPGIEKDKIDVEVRNNSLTLKGFRSVAQEEKNTTAGFVRMERRFGAFVKTITLPAPVDETHAKASYLNGVLTIELPKLVPGPKDEKSTKVIVA